MSLEERPPGCLVDADKAGEAKVGIPSHSLANTRKALSPTVQPHDSLYQVLHSFSLPLISTRILLSLFIIAMADAFSTVAAVVSLADVMIRACEGISNLVVSLKDAPDAAQHLRQTVQNVKSLLVNLQLYLSEYESSNLSIGQHQFLPETMKKELSEIRKELDCLQQFLPPFGTQEKLGQRLKRVFDEKRIPRVVRRLESRQIALGTGLQIVAQ